MKLQAKTIFIIFCLSLFTSVYFVVITKLYFLNTWNLFQNYPFFRRSNPDDAVCSLVGNGTSVNQFSYSKRYSSSLSHYEMQQLFGSCSQLIHHYSFITNLDDVSSIEKRNPVAFSILAHQNVNQLLMLLAEIYAPHNAYCLHIDRKASKGMMDTVEMVIKCFPNILLSSKRENVVYASFSRLQADINCMADLLNTNITWKYLLNLCGQDFPLKTNREIVLKLETLEGYSLIPNHVDTNKQSLERTRFSHKVENRTGDDGELEQVLVKTNNVKEPPPFNLTVRKNLAYNIYSRRFLQWAIFESTKAKVLLDWLKDARTPDEQYWSMLNSLGDSPDHSRSVTRKTFYPFVVWNHSNNTCAGYWKHYSCVYGSGDVHQLLKSPHFFANKFDISHDSLPIVCLRKWLKERRLKWTQIP